VVCKEVRDGSRNSNKYGMKEMVFKKRWLFVILAGILALSLLLGCAGEEATPAPKEPPVPTPTPEIPPQVAPIPVDEVSLEEAEEVVGVPLRPEYLPAGWEFQRGFVRYHGSPPRADLSLYFSDEEITEEVKTLQDFNSFTYKIVLHVDQVKEMPPPDYPQGMVDHYGGKVVDINGIKGWLSSGGHDLHWFLPGLHFYMYVAVDLPEEEILRIAQAID